MKKSFVILLVEDNPHVMMLFSTALREAGHKVVEADSGEKALLLGSLHAPDLILLDIGLPGMSGMSVASELREHPALAELPIIAVTARRLTLDEMTEVGIDAAIYKPILPRTFAEEVESWMLRRAEERSAGDEA
jgi:CheY-like chemotaxis protein